MVPLSLDSGRTKADGYMGYLTWDESDYNRNPDNHFYAHPPAAARNDCLRLTQVVSELLSCSTQQSAVPRSATVQNVEFKPVVLEDREIG